MINKTRIYLVLIIILSALLHCSYCAYAEKTVVVIKSQDLSAYNKVVKGFQDECFKNDITIKSIYDLNGKMKIGQKIVRKVRKEKPDIKGKNRRYTYSVLYGNQSCKISAYGIQHNRHIH